MANFDAKIDLIFYAKWSAAKRPKKTPWSGPHKAPRSSQKRRAASRPSRVVTRKTSKNIGFPPFLPRVSCNFWGDGGEIFLIMDAIEIEVENAYLMLLLKGRGAALADDTRPDVNVHHARKPLAFAGLP